MSYVNLLCLLFEVNFDDNAEYRQKEIHDLRDESQEDAREVAAKKSADRPGGLGKVASGDATCLVVRDSFRGGVCSALLHDLDC